MHLNLRHMMFCTKSHIETLPRKFFMRYECEYAEGGKFWKQRKKLQ
jgi:hypothetical protein